MKTILLVEDEAIIAMMETNDLKKEGYTVLQAFNGPEAIEKARANIGKIDLILMDIDLGQGMDGTEAALEILKEQDVPILFLSSHTEKEVVDKTEKITSYGYVVKNTGVTVFAASIRMAFKLHEAYKSIREKNMEIEAANEEFQTVNEELEKANEELARSEKALKERETQYRLLADNMSDTVWLMDMNLKTVYISPSTLRVRGYTLEEINDMPLERHVTPDSYQRAMKLLAEALSPENLNNPNPRLNYSIELEFFRKDGSKFWSDIAFTLILDRNGRPANILGCGRDISDRKRAEEALRESEKRVRRKLDALLSPEEDIDALELSDIIDTETVQALMDEFYRLTNIGIGIIDLHGKVLVGTGWQDICTKFHRVNPESCRLCIESDLELSSNVPPGTYKQYRCRNNMWDIATPIMLGDKHVGNIFLGQFLFDDETPDYEVFRRQARRYGFNEKEYLSALERVPRWSRQQVDATMSFYAIFASMIGTLSYSNIKLARALEGRHRSEHRHTERTHPA